MSDEHSVPLQRRMQFVPTRLPKIVLQRVEEQFPPYREMMNRMDILKDEHGSPSKRYATSTVNGNEANVIEAERVLDITEKGDQDQTTISVIKSEPNNCMGFVEGGTGSCSDTCVTCDVDGSEWAIDIKDETAEAISFPSIKTENECAQNEQLQVHHAECRYSCDIHRGGGRYLCEECNKVFSKKYNLIRHKRIHSGEHPYTCDVCNKGFIQKNNLKTHQRTHSGERPYSCNVCNKEFSQKGSLKSHQRTHSGERPYTCEVCYKSFISNSSLKTHQLTHSGDRPYTCEVCYKAFSLRCSLKTHQCRRRHSGERPYSCHVCNKKFSQKDHVKTHLITHSGERSYTCDVCYKAFSLKGNLKTHQRTHTGVRPYTCEVCDKAFCFLSSLKAHQRTHCG